MKKLIMFVIVFCIASSAYALDDPLYWYALNGDTSDFMGNGPDGTLVGNATFVSDPCMGDVLELDGDGDYVEIADKLVDFVVSETFQSFTIGAWIKTPAVTGSDCGGGIFFKGATDDGGEEWAEGEKMFYIDTDSCGEGGNDNTASFVGWGCDWVRGDTTIAADDTWHHVAVVVDGTAETGTVYIDGVDTTDEDALNFDDPPSDRDEDISFIGYTEFHGSELTGRIALVALYQSALTAGEVSDLMDLRPYGPKNPIAIDPNVMLVYETGTTEGDFEVSLKFPPMGQGSPGNPKGTPISMEIIVDPNGFDGGKNLDLTLIGSSDPCNNRITFTRTTANWNVPEVIRFKAIDDSEAEPPDLIEAQSISVWAVPTPYEPNLARPVAQKVAGGEVWDNDQADILFTYSLPEKTAPFASVTGPVQLWEDIRVRYGSDYIRWRNIGVTLQVPPRIDGDPCQPTTSVKLNAEVSGEIEGNNLPHTDPCLPYIESDDPNGMIFTASDYQTSQAIKVWGVDDDVLQVEAYADGEQNYQATLSVWVIDDGGDPRYAKFDEDNPKTVTLDIEDNECGAFGVLSLDIGNPNAFTDPNYQDSEGNPLPDCVVNLYDVIEMATRWLNCSDPQTVGCTQYNN